jgi:hypothetical protein
MTGLVALDRVDRAPNWLVLAPFGQRSCGPTPVWCAATRSVRDSC